MGSKGSEEFALRLLCLQIAGNFVLQRWYEAWQLRGIEQATVDQEFWELVGDGKK